MTIFDINEIKDSSCQSQNCTTCLRSEIRNQKVFMIVVCFVFDVGHCGEGGGVRGDSCKTKFSDLMNTSGNNKEIWNP